ncbi:MAG: hypothetical protein ACPG8W_10260, partial [Candidatus Promineifilaceae bacterium]
LEFPPFPTNNLKINTYFSEIRRLVRAFPKWSVSSNSITLGFFSFTKSLLYNDLLAIDNAQLTNSLLADLLDPNGFYDPFSTADSGVALDSQLKIIDNHLVMDADSSQMRVLLDVRAGRDLVVQGPPGTGKSQTITNLIADAIGCNKTVLFVSEKMAALDVVKQRLDNVGIGDAALVLHSHRTTRHNFGKEIRRTLRLGAVAELADESVPLQFPHIHELEGAQKRLINYIESINRPIANYETIYELHGRQFVLADRLAHLEPSQRDPNIWRSIAGTLLRDHLPTIRKLERVRQQTGQLTHHPFGATTHTNVTPSLIRYITINSKRAITQLQTLQNAANRLTQLLLSPALNSLDGVASLLTLAGQATYPPDMHDINIHSPEWATIDAEALTNALEAQVKVDQYKQQYDAILLPEAWEMPALSIRQGLMSGKGLMRRFSADFRRARTQLAGLCHHGLPNGQDAQLQLVDTVLAVQRLNQQIDPYREQFQRLFGERLHERDWYELARAVYWLHLVHKVGVSSTQLQHLAQGQNSQQVTHLQEQVQTAATALEKTLTELWLKLSMPREMALSFDRLIGRLNSWHTTPQQIEAIVELNQLSADFRLYPIIRDVLYNWPPAGDYLTDWVEYTALTQLLDDVRIERPTLGNGAAHKSAEQFRDLDRAFLQHNRQRLAQQLGKGSRKGQLFYIANTILF